VIPKGTRGQGFKGSSEILNNYRDLKVWQKSKQERHRGSRKNVKGDDKIFRIQTLEPLTPGILGPSSPTNLEKNQQ
jgi:hypothetical protein